MLDVVCNPVLRCGKQRVKASYFGIIHRSQNRIFQSIGTTMSLPIISDIYHYKNEAHIAKYHRRVDVVMQLPNTASEAM